MGAGAAMGGKLHGAIRNGEPQRRADRALDQTDFAAMRTHELGSDGKPEPGTAGAGRTLERLEQMRARLFGEAGAGVGNLDHDHRAFTTAGDADLVAPWIAIGTAFAGLAFHAPARHCGRD